MRPIATTRAALDDLLCSSGRKAMSAPTITTLAAAIGQARTRRVPRTVRGVLAVGASWTFAVSTCGGGASTGGAAATTGAAGFDCGADFGGGRRSADSAALRSRAAR